MLLSSRTISYATQHVSDLTRLQLAYSVGSMEESWS